MTRCRRNKLELTNFLAPKSLYLSFYDRWNVAFWWQSATLVLLGYDSHLVGISHRLHGPWLKKIKVD